MLPHRRRGHWRRSRIATRDTEGRIVGSVRFFVGNHTLCVAQVEDGSASCASRRLPAAGTFLVTAAYSGTTGVAGVTATARVTVARGQVRVTGRITPLAKGRARYLATVTARTPGFGRPGGAITFLAGGHPLCARSLRDGRASCVGAMPQGTVRIAYHPGRDYVAPKREPVAKLG